MTTYSHQLDDLPATRSFARQLAERVQTPATIALEGTLGAGKTQWIRFFAEALGVPSEAVTSPTYVLQQRYHGSKLLYHFDFYRLNSPAEVWDLGIDELYEQQAIVLIEWADRFPECLPEERITLRLQQTSGDQRVAHTTPHGPRCTAMLEGLTST